MKKNPRHKPLTPLQQLQADREMLNKRCKAEEYNLKVSWENVRSNAGSLVFSGIRSLVFPKRNKETSTHNTGFWSSIMLNLPYYLSLVREGMFIGKNILLPFYYKLFGKNKPAED